MNLASEICFSQNDWRASCCIFVVYFQELRLRVVSFCWFLDCIIPIRRGSWPWTRCMLVEVPNKKGTWQQHGNYIKVFVLWTFVATSLSLLNQISIDVYVVVEPILKTLSHMICVNPGDQAQRLAVVALWFIRFTGFTLCFTHLYVCNPM